MEKELEDLQNLYKNGLITEEVYAQRQQEIMSRGGAAGSYQPNTGVVYVTPTPTFTPVTPVHVPPAVGEPDFPHQVKNGRHKKFIHCGCPDWSCGTWFLYVIVWMIVLTLQTIGTVFAVINLINLFNDENLPFFHSSRGFIAIGGSATGFIAIGQFATGFITIGQFGFGFINLSMLGVGILASAGMISGSLGISVGMMCIGGYIPAAMFGIATVFVKIALFGMHLIFPLISESDKRKLMKKPGCK